MARIRAIKALTNGFAVVSQLGNWETTAKPWCWEAVSRLVRKMPFGIFLTFLINLGRVRGPAAQAQPVGLVCSGLAPLLAVLLLRSAPDQPGWVAPTPTGYGTFSTAGLRPAGESKPQPLAEVPLRTRTATFVVGPVQ